MLAAAKGHDKCVSALLAAGAWLEGVDMNAETALGMAVSHGHAGCASQLLHQGAAMRKGSRVKGLSSALASCHRQAPSSVGVVRAVIQAESRWRRRRPLALVREQRVAAKDEAMARRVWNHVEV